MAIIESPLTTTAIVEDGNVLFASNGYHVVLHPQWLRHRSTEPGQIDPTNRQRLFTPTDIDPDLSVEGAEVSGDCMTVQFSDTHIARLSLVGLLQALGWVDDPEEPPAPVAWRAPLAVAPSVDWNDIREPGESASQQAMVEFLDEFYTHGYVLIRNTPAEVGTVERVAQRVGYLVGNNFGAVFDVRSEPKPTDLAYTAVELLAHTDQPYKMPSPGIQLLHCIHNEAPGGDSTIVDGLAAYQAMLREVPELCAAMTNTEVVYRYDMGVDTVVGREFTFELDNAGRFRKMRFNTKLDEPVLSRSDGSGDATRPAIADLNAFYEGRRWLASWLNDPAHQATFRLAPGDVLFMDNHRMLHGRTAFDPSSGRRHLQGCYVEHDGPDTTYRLARRALGSAST